MTYFTLGEAAKYVEANTGRKLEPSDILRAGVAGHLCLCAPFGSGRIYNASARANGDFVTTMPMVPVRRATQFATHGRDSSGPFDVHEKRLDKNPDDFRTALLVIPPGHLMEIETEGRAVIQVAFGLDNTVYFPGKSRTLDHLRVSAADLDHFILSTSTEDVLKADIDAHSESTQRWTAANRAATSALEMTRNVSAQRWPIGHSDASELEALFDGVSYVALEKMFPNGSGTPWKSLVERAGRNGLKAAAKVKRGTYNPLQAAQWWLTNQKPHGWDWARCCRVLAKNLPARSAHKKNMLDDKAD